MPSPMGIGLSLTQLLMSMGKRKDSIFSIMSHIKSVQSYNLALTNQSYTIECYLFMDKPLNSCDPVRVQLQENMLFFSS